MRHAKIGMRTIKTVIAVIITLGIGELFGLKSPILACVGAIITMESSISESFKTGANRIYGTILGGLVALILISLAPINFFFLGLGLILIINLCIYFKLEKSVSISMVVFLIISLDYRGGNGINYIFHRTLDTLIGVIIGTATNFLIRPPKVEERIKATIEKMHLTTLENLKNLIWTKGPIGVEMLTEEIVSAEEDYKLLIKDLRFTLGKNKDYDLFLDIFDSFEVIRNHLSVIQIGEDKAYINNENKQFLEKYFNRAIPNQEDFEEDDFQIIFNYHLRKVVDRLIHIDQIKHRAHKLGSF